MSHFNFLGLKYDVENQLLEGNTRNGSRLTFDTARKGIFDLIKFLKNEDLKYGNQLEHLVKASVFGTFQSRLYEGTWEIKQWPEHKWTIKENSLMHLQRKTERNNLSGPHSIYYLVPLVRKSMKIRTDIRK